MFFHSSSNLVFLVLGNKKTKIKKKMFVFHQIQKMQFLRAFYGSRLTPTTLKNCSGSYFYSFFPTKTDNPCSGKNKRESNDKM